MATGKGKKKQEVLDYNAQVRTLREQGPGRLYLLWGREDYLREQYLIELKKLCLPGGEDDFSYHRFDGAGRGGRGAVFVRAHAHRGARL